MSNIFQKLGVSIADCGRWLANAISDTVHLAEKVEQILKAEAPLEAPFVAGLATVVRDVEAIIAASGAAVSAEGLNFPADSQVYSDFLTLIADFKKLAPIVEEAMDVLKGKTVTK